MTEWGREEMLLVLIESVETKEKHYSGKHWIVDIKNLWFSFLLFLFWVANLVSNQSSRFRAAKTCFFGITVFLHQNKIPVDRIDIRSTGNKFVLPWTIRHCQSRNLQKAKSTLFREGSDARGLRSTALIEVQNRKHQAWVLCLHFQWVFLQRLVVYARRSFATPAAVKWCQMPDTQITLQL